MRNILEVHSSLKLPSFLLFLQLLVSPMVSTRVYSNQIEELLQLFESYGGAEGLMTLDQFAFLAKMLLTMIYQNAYPDVVRD